MNNKLKKALAMFTSFSLGAAMITSIPYVMAEGEGVELASTGRTMSVEFMGRGATPQDVSPGSAKLQSSDVANMTNSGEFWIGLAVDKVDDLALFTDGVYSLEVGFEYDPDFVTPYTDTTYTTWQSALEAGNLQNPVSNATAWWDSNDYEIVAHDNVDLYSDPDREDVSEVSTRQTEGWRMCTACVTLKASAADARRFTGLASSDKQYVLKLPFKLKRVPTEAEDQNPKVISLVRGPETLDIGSGTDGTDPMAMWVAYDEGTATAAEKTDQQNMKNLFTYGGDISLFGQGGSITDIVIDKYVAPSPTPTEEPEQYQIYEEKALTTAGFKEETTTYYASVPNETEKITLTITSSESPTVQANGASVTTTSGAGGTYVTAEFALDELDKLKEADGFNNTVTVTAGSNTYTVYIRRLLKPKIVLNYGNSPYGELYSHFTGDELTAKKASFDTTYKLWDDDLVWPDDTSVQKNAHKNLKYWPFAWNEKYNDTKSFSEDPSINLDRDTHAIFVYRGEDFVEPGFKAYNAMGEEMSSKSDFQAEMKINDVVCLKSVGLSNLNSNLTTETKIITLKTGNGTKVTELSGLFVKPGVYDIVYSVKDDITNETIEETRKMVFLWDNGDINMSAFVDSNDSKAGTSYVKNADKVSNYFSGRMLSLYYYRIIDGNNSGFFDSNDSKAVISYVKGDKTTLQRFYRKLK